MPQRDLTNMLIETLIKQRLTEKEDERKQARFKKNIEALKTSGGLMGDIYPKGVSSEGTLDYGIRSPEEKIKLAESMSQFQRQQDIGKMVKSQALLEQPARPTSNVNLLGMAKIGQKPEAKLMTTAGQRLLARQAVKETPPELQGRNFLLSAEGKYRETAPKLPKDMNKDAFSVAAKLAGDPLMYDDQVAYRQAIIDNIPQAQEILKQTKTTPTKTSGKSPYKEFPDAFLEGGTWKVMRKGKKYKIED